MPQGLRISLLGNMRVELDDHSVTGRLAAKAAALLAYLAVTGHAHTRQMLAGLLWPDVLETSARGSLRGALMNLRQTLPNYVLSSRQEIGLEFGRGVWLDVAIFADACRHLQATAHPLPQPERASVRAAIYLYRDDFLAGFQMPDAEPFQAWAVQQQEHYRRQALQSLAQLAATALRHNELNSGLQDANRLLAIDPLHEEGYRLAMQLLARRGDRSTALAHYKTCRRLLADELGVEPDPTTTALAEQIRRGELQQETAGPSAPAAAVAVVNEPGSPRVRHNLPAQLTAFIGRKRELADLDKLLSDPAIRLVTILGPGGSGKSRLAIEAAKRYLGGERQRAVFVALAPLQSADELPTAIAAAAGLLLQQDGRTPAEQLVDYFAGRSQILLVLDNIEHLLESTPLLSQMLQAAPNLTLLTTSRERLLLSGETVFALGGMVIRPWDSLAAALEEDAVQLFLQGARRTRPDYQLVDQELAPITRICQLVGGMPLGILLAAAWTDLLPPEEIAAEIGRSLDFLQTELRDVPARQRSLRVVFEQSWQRLGEEEQSSLMKLAVFRGGFDRTMAAQVAGAPLRTLSGLANKSLLQSDPDGHYTIHELLRQYAEEELEKSGAAHATHAAYAAFFAHFLAERDAALQGAGQKTAHHEVEVNLENIRAAWHWSVEQDNMQLWEAAIQSLGLVYEYHARFHEARTLFARAADQMAATLSPAEQRLFVRLRILQARFERITGHRERARTLLQHCLSLFDTVADSNWDTRPEQAAILRELGNIAYHTAHARQATTFYENSLNLFRALGNRRGEAALLIEREGIWRNLHGLGRAEDHIRQTGKARQMVLEALTIFRELGDQANIAEALSGLGVTFLTVGHPIEAIAALEECLAICMDLEWYGTTWIDATGFLGIAKEYLGQYDEMRGHGQQMLSLAQEIDYPHGLHLGSYLIGGAALAQRQYTSAVEWLERDVEVSRTRDRSGTTAFSLSGLALATYWSGNKARTQQLFIQLLRLANNIRTLRGTIHSLLVAGLLLIDQEEVELAIELYSLAATYGPVGNSRWCDDVAGQPILAAAASSLPPDVIATAQERGRQRDLWKSVEQLLTLFAGERAA